ncbi:unnamed protein product [Effrenium voratum]|uniref:Anoctamin transmembrane domain-containing protein n=1 Tax=Effrenium voratum TaxID=2562239 RepID=A0AA36I5Y9_9DINO|nr:unnamed protein product [Effrenium voratum]
MEPMPVPEWEDPEVRAEVPAREPDAAREEPVPAAPREERLSTAMPSLAPREELKGALTKTADSALPGEHSDAEPQEPAELQPQEPQEPQEFQEPEAVAEARASPGKADARGRSGKGKAKSKPGHRQKSVDAARGTQSAMAAEEPVLVPPAPGVRFSPSVIGKHEVLLDVDEKAGEFPQYHRMPPSLPFHFRLDVSALKFSANGLAKAKWLQKLREELEKNWRYSRKDQERAWVREGELPGEVRDILERNGKCSEQVMAAVQRRRADPSWQEENDQGQMEKTMPMHVLRLERLARRGEELTQEDAKEITEEGLWCNMIYDLSTDPLLQDIGYAGQNPTQFSAMVLIYTRHLDKLDLKKDLTQELRVAHVDHFEYGLCFPIRPYPSCQLPPPPDREDLSWIFEREGRTADGAELERLVKQGDAMMTTLFWQCFDAFFHADYKRQSTTKPAFSRTQLFAKPTAKDLTACGTRQEALLALLSILRAQAFQFPFCQKVTFVEAVEHRKSQKSFPGAGHCDVLAAAEVAVQRALREYTAAMQDGNQEMPQWAERPIRLRERDFATAATPPGNSEEQSPVPLLVQLPQPGMAMLHCVGLSPLKKEELEEKDNECDSGSESSKQNEEEPGAENEEEVEAQDMLLTLDVSNWHPERGDGEIVVSDINIDDYASIREALLVVKQLETIMENEAKDRQEGGKDPDRWKRLGRLAYGLRALQRASLKLKLQRVGAAVLETKRQVPMEQSLVQRARRRWGAKGGDEVLEEEEEESQRVMLLTVPEFVLRKRAEARGLQRRVVPHKKTDKFLGGFQRDQFYQKGPLQKYWVETHQQPYAYQPYFRPPCPSIDPAALLSNAERKFLIKTFITDAPHENPKQGGANMDPRQLQADDIIDSGGLLHLHSRMSESHLTRGFMYPWRSKGLWDYYVVKRCRCDIDLVLRHYGPKIASYFDFLETYSSFLLIASVLGVCAEIAGPPNGYSDGFGKSIQPGFGVCISMWGTFFCILWRRRAAWLAHNWQNGWVEEGEDIGGAGAVTTMSRVRPEFALQWRKNFDNASQDDQQQTYHMLRGLLKIPHADDPHFDDRALKTDIMHFDEACYLSDWLQIWRSLVSYLASGVFILFATTATFGALAARQALGLEGTTAGYAVTGLTSSVLVPLLNVVHYQVVIYTNNYQLFRDDSAKEKDFFDRLFIFNLFNTYNSLLWIVFAERNMAQLRVQVLFLCLSSIFMNNFIEFYWSLWMKQLKKMKSNSLPVASNMWTTLRYLLTGELHDDGVPEPMDPVSTALEHVSEELSRDLPFEVVDEAIELVIQYGVIMMFTVAFPMAPLLAFINVHIEKRLDSLKIVKLMQFPEPRMVVGMGRPFAAFVIVTGLGLLVSGLTLYFAAYEGRDCERCDTWGSCSGCAGTSVQLLLPEATTELRLFLLGGGGTVMLLVMYICFSSPPLSIKIVHEQYRQKMYENRLRFRRETGDAHGRLSRRVSVKGPASPQGMPE